MFTKPKLGVAAIGAIQAGSGTAVFRLISVTILKSG